MVYDTQITIVNGIYKPTNITGGPHIVCIHVFLDVLYWENHRTKQLYLIAILDYGRVKHHGFAPFMRMDQRRSSRQNDRRSLKEIQTENT